MATSCLSSQTPRNRPSSCVRGPRGPGLVNSTRSRMADTSRSPNSTTLARTTSLIDVGATICSAVVASSMVKSLRRIDRVRREQCDTIIVGHQRPQRRITFLRGVFGRGKWRHRRGVTPSTIIPFGDRALHRRQCIPYRMVERVAAFRERNWSSQGFPPFNIVGAPATAERPVAPCRSDQESRACVAEPAFHARKRIWVIISSEKRRTRFPPAAG